MWLLCDLFGKVSSICCRQDLMKWKHSFLASLCVGAVAGVRLRACVLFPLILLCFVVVTAWGLAQNQSSWSIIVMSLVGSACLQLLFGRHGAKLPHDCRQTKPTRAPAPGSPIYSIGDPAFPPTVRWPFDWPPPTSSSIHQPNRPPKRRACSLPFSSLSR